MGATFRRVVALLNMKPSQCLTNSQMIQILSGALTPQESSHAEDHLDTCNDCMTLLVDLVKVSPEPAGSQTAENKPVSDD